MIAIVLIPLVLFRSTLSYVIVVQKAMGVGVALRQGLQYTLAKGGIRVLQMIAVGTVIVAGTTMAGNANHERPQKIIVILVGITAYFTIRRLGDGLRTWVDRRFFRENYNAENVLTELSEHVRSIVEPRSLLETVAGRISETLHVPQVAILLSGSGFYQPAFAMGYATLPTVGFPSKTGTAMVLKSQKEPARVFLNDRESWVYASRPSATKSDVSWPRCNRNCCCRSRCEINSWALFLSAPSDRRNPTPAPMCACSSRSRHKPDWRSKMPICCKPSPTRWRNAKGSTAKSRSRAKCRSGSFPRNYRSLRASITQVIAGPPSASAATTTIFLLCPTEPRHRDRRCFGQRDCRCPDDGQPAGLAASEATRAPENLAAAVANVNRLVYEASASNRYATFFYGQYDPRKAVRLVNAGHNPPMLFHRADGGAVTRLEPGGTVVGLIENACYQQGSVRISPGDLLVAFTDGISEAMNLEDEEWGEERLNRVRPRLPAKNSARDARLYFRRRYPIRRRCSAA